MIPNKIQAQHLWADWSHELQGDLSGWRQAGGEEHGNYNRAEGLIQAQHNNEDSRKNFRGEVSRRPTDYQPSHANVYEDTGDNPASGIWRQRESPSETEILHREHWGANPRYCTGQPSPPPSPSCISRPHDRLAGDTGTQQAKQHFHNSDGKLLPASASVINQSSNRPEVTFRQSRSQNKVSALPPSSGSH